MQCEHEDRSRCQTPVGHGDDVKCLFLCSDCGEEFDPEDGERCINGIGFKMTARADVWATMREIQSEVPKM